MTAPHATPALYLPSLDGLRTFAFLSVFMHHNLAGPAQLGLADLQRQGWVGVELFFAVSAFLFFHLFRAEYERAGRISVSAFLVRRVLRLYPLLVAFTAAMAIYGTIAGKVAAGVAFARFAGIAGSFENLLVWVKGFSTIPFTPHLWTIAYEFQIYLCIPAAYYAYVRWGRARFLYGLLGVWVFAMLARLAFVLLDASHAIWTGPFLRPESTLIGLTIATGVLDRLKPIVVGVVFLVALAVLGAIPGVDQGGWPTMYIYPVAATACGALLWLGIRSAWLGRVLGSAPFRYLGKISYGLYVYHLAAIHLGWLAAAALGYSYFTVAGFFATLALSLVFCIAMSAASYQFLERPFLKVKQRLAIVTGRAV